jgi:hypothetical protein
MSRAATLMRAIAIYETRGLIDAVAFLMLFGSSFEAAIDLLAAYDKLKEELKR